MTGTDQQPTHNYHVMLTDGETVDLSTVRKGMDTDEVTKALAHYLRPDASLFGRDADGDYIVLPAKSILYVTVTECVAPPATDEPADDATAPPAPADPVPAQPADTSPAYL